MAGRVIIEEFGNSKRNDPDSFSGKTEVLRASSYTSVAGVQISSMREDKVKREQTVLVHGASVDPVDRQCWMRFSYSATAFLIFIAL
eukprot:gene7496-2726_t